MKGRKIITAVFILLLIISASVSVLTGSFSLSAEDIFNIITLRERGTLGAEVLFSLRLPRVMAGILGGAALSLAGAVYQTVFANPLASPDLTGVASGASFGAACAIVFGAGSALGIMTGAFISGILSLIFVMLLVKISGAKNTGSYILSGVIISAAADAGLMILKSLADPERELASIEYWIMGSFSGVTLKTLLPALPFIIIPSAALILFSRQTLILSLGTEHAAGVGVSPVFWRSLLLSLGTLAVASVAAFAGTISFLGLIAPHIVFLFIKKRDYLFFILSAVSGSILLLTADILARTLSPGAELPLSIFTVLLSVPVLVVLMVKRGRSEDV